MSGAGEELLVGPLQPTYHHDLFVLFADIVEKKEGYPQAPPLSAATFEATWLTTVTMTVAATVAGRLVGAYYLKPNFPGRAAHIANAGYVAAASARGASATDAISVNTSSGKAITTGPGRPCIAM